MPIDLSKVQWDAEPIDIGAVQWDAPAATQKRPAASTKPKPQRANFGNVRGGGDTVGRPLDRYGFPSAEGVKTVPYRPGMGRIEGPSYPYDPGYTERAMLANKRKDFKSLPAPVRAMVGVGESVNKAAIGAGQLGALALDQVSPRQRTTADLVSGRKNSRYADMQRAEAERRKQDAYMEGDVAAGVGNLLGDIAMTAAPVSRLAALPKAGQYAGAAALGGGYGALQPIIDGESRTTNALVGGAAGLVGQGLSNALSKSGAKAAAQAPKTKRQLITLAQREGIPLHASQVSDSIPAKTIASAAKYLPFSGAGKAAQRQQGAFNRAVSRTFGADADELTDEVMQSARRKINRGFDDIYSRANIEMTPDALRRLAATEGRLAKGLTQDESRILSNQLDDILAEAADTGALTGPKYQALRTQIMGGEGADRVGMAVKALRAELDDIAAKAVGETDAKALKALRGQWANLKTTEALLKQVSGAGGDIKPASIWGAIRKGSTKEMRQLGKLGQVVLKDPIPDSGTAGRAVANNALNPLAWPVLAPATLGGLTVGRVANSKSVANALALVGRGQTRKAISGYPKYLLPGAAVPAAANAQKTKGDKRKR